MSDQTPIIAEDVIKDAKQKKKYDRLYAKKNHCHYTGCNAKSMTDYCLHHSHECMYIDKKGNRCQRRHRGDKPSRPSEEFCTYHTPQYLAEKRNRTNTRRWRAGMKPRAQTLARAAIQDPPIICV